MKKCSAILLALLLVLSAIPACAQGSLTNIALQKTVTAGNYSNEHHKSHLTDGLSATYVNGSGSLTDNEGGVASTVANGNNWYQIDLEKQYYIDHIKLYDDSAFWSSIYNFRILASADADFSESTILYETVEWDDTVTLPLTVPSDGEAYRYIRLEKVNASYNMEYQYTELEVWADPSEVIEETPVVLENAALLKPVTAGRYIDATTKDDINDGNESTGVYYVPTGTKTDNPDGVLSEAENDWYQIDMGEPYLVDHIILKRGGTNWMTPMCFKIMVSNSPDFSDGTAVTLFEVGESPGATFPLTVEGDGNYYRYVRLQRTGQTSYESYTELEVWSPGALRTNVTAAITDNQTIRLTFDRDMEFATAAGIVVSDKSTNTHPSFSINEIDLRTLDLVFAEEMSEKTLSITLPKELKSLDEIAVNKAEIEVTFPNVVTVQNFSFIDGASSQITSLSGLTTVGFSANVVNQTATLSGKCVLILAFYEGDNMVSVSDITASVAAGQTQPISLTVDISGKNADSAAVYIWNNYTKAVTLSQTYELY